VLQSTPLLEVQMTSGTTIDRIPTLLVGDYNLPNVLVAVAVGEYFGVPANSIQSAITGYVPSNSRSQLVHKGSNRIILDAYNANPTSLKAAIENFARQHDPAKVLVVGAMAEMGPASLEEHAGIVSLIGQFTWKDVILVGGDFGQVPHPYRYFPDSATARDWMAKQDWKDTAFLIKGSRSTRMETVLEAFGA
jgi:UDP-N-acetylmuramoyl-tripeptide--D-alanyl-D-alanine ligase